MISVVIAGACMLAEYFARTCLREYLTYSYNSGAAFGILGGSPELLIWLEVIANVCVVCALVCVRMRLLTRAGLSVMLGGALSNLSERVMIGYVIDWIPVPFMNLRYNLSDVFIGVGALMVFVSVMRGE